MLGPPEARHKPGVAATLIFLIESYTTLDGGPHPLRTDVFDGNPLHDDNPYVRHITRRIEAANPVDGDQKPPASKDITI